MKQLVTSWLVLAAFILGHAQSPNIVIRGRVAAAETGDPLPHARVVIYNGATPRPPIFTDTEGRFASAALTPGRYRLSVTKAGYALTSVERVDVSAPDGNDIRLPRIAAISGRVVDRFGEPAAGVIMSLLDPPSPDRTKAGAIVRRVTTDDLGEYRFGGLAEGTYFVTATTRQLYNTTQRNRFSESILYYPGNVTITEAQGIAVRPGDDTSGIDFAGIGSQQNEFTITSQIALQGGVVFGPNGTSSGQLRATGTGVIRGRVTGVDGLPLAHSTVTAMAPPTPVGETSAGHRSVQTDENGEYELVDLPAGQYRIYAAKLAYTTTSYGQRTGNEQGTPIDLAKGQTRTRIDIGLLRYGAVTGRILDEYGDPVERVAVNISQIAFQDGRRRLTGVMGVAGCDTDDLGRYRLYGLPPGQYIVSTASGQVTPFRPGQVTPIQPGPDLSGYAPTYFPGTTNAGEARLVPVERSQDVTGLDFALAPTPTAMISGKRVGSDGQPLGGSLRLVQSQRSGAIVTSPAGARTYDDGRFEFPNVATGDYVIQADRGKQDVGVEGDFVSQFVTVNGTDVPDVLLQATPGSTISGRVVFDGDGTPPQGRAFTIVPARADLDRAPLSGDSIARGEVRQDLTFVMMGIHGPRRLALDRRPPGWDLKSVIANGVDVTDAPLSFGTPDQSLADVQIVITNRLTELIGTVVDSRGQPATGYTVLVFPSDRERWYPGSRYFRRVSPESPAYFTVRGLPPAEYIVAPVVSGLRVLTDGVDAWQDPEFLESIALRAARATLTEGQRLSIGARLLTP